MIAHSPTRPLTHSLLLLALLCVLCASVVNPVFAATFYVDGAWGSNTNAGLSADSPKANISAAITAASDGDTIQIAAGFYQETNWNPGVKNLTLVPQGEVKVYDTDPWQTDSDSDGIPDAWEMLYGLNPSTNDAAQASALPWAQALGWSNFQVYTNGIDPRLTEVPAPQIEAHASPGPNTNGWNNTSVAVWFTATNAISYTPSVTNSFPGETNDVVVVGTAVNAAGVMAQAYAYVNIDTNAPTLTLIPGPGDTNDWSNPVLSIEYADTNGLVSSGLNLDTLVVMLGSNDVTTNFYKFASGAVLSTNLPEGSYTWSASITDYAGNVFTSSVSFYATGTTNNLAPVMSNLDLTNAVAVLPDVPEVWVQGQVTGDDSIVMASVNCGEAITMNRRSDGDDFGYLLPLADGTNVIVLVASDSGGSNVSSRVVLVERSAKFRAEITSPEFGSFAEGQSNVVSGYVSAQMNDGTTNAPTLVAVHINGMTTTLGGVDANGNVAFTSDAALPPVDGAQAITGEAVWSDGQVTALPPSYRSDYEVVARHTAAESSLEIESYGAWARWPSTGYGSCSNDQWATGGHRERVSRDAVQVGAAQFSVTTSNLSWQAPECAEGFWPCSNDWWVAENFAGATSSSSDPESRGLSVGVWNEIWKEESGYMQYAIYATAPDGSTNGWYSPCDDPNGVCNGECPTGWTINWSPFHDAYNCQAPIIGYGPASDPYLGETYDLWSRAAGGLEFRAPLHYPTNQLVIFTFTNMWYATGSEDEQTASDLAQVKFIWGGQTNEPVAVSNELRTVSYLIRVDGGAKYSLSENNFVWPAFGPTATTSGTTTGGYFIAVWTATTTVTNHFLSFSGFHNQKHGWKITRNYQSQADAECDAYVYLTIDELAQKIHLEASEYTNWLESADGKLRPTTSSEKISDARHFKIPNEAHITKGNAFPWQDFLVARKELLITNVYTNKQNKFKVVDHLGDVQWGQPKQDVLDILATQSNIYVWSHYGHGVANPNGNLEMTGCAGVGGDFCNIDPTEVHLKYKLAEVVLYSCKAGVKDAQWLDLVAKGGCLYSTTNTFGPPGPIGTYNLIWFNAYKPLTGKTKQ